MYEFDELELRMDDLEQRFEAASTTHDQPFFMIILNSIWSLGAGIAIVLSWFRNESILWCIAHGILGWLYVAYFAWTR